MNDITQTLAERGKRYGCFRDHARISQALEDVLRAEPNWQKLHAYQKEALKMVVHKIARIMNGDPHFHDSWHDIEGYIRLAADFVKEDACTEPKGVYEGGISICATALPQPDSFLRSKAGELSVQVRGYTVQHLERKFFTLHMTEVDKELKPIEGRAPVHVQEVLYTFGCLKNFYDRWEKV